MPLSLLLIPAMAVINRFRGGGFGADAMPGHPRYWVSPIVFLLATMVLVPWKVALAITAGWLLWHLLPHGHTYSLGRFRPARPVSAFEQWSIDLLGIERAYFVKAALFAPVALLGIWTGQSVAVDVAWAVAMPFAFLTVRHFTMPTRNDIAEMAEGALVGAWLSTTTI